MKTIQKGTEIKRANDLDAESLVRHKGYSYVPKSVYKEQFKKEETKPVVEAKAETQEERPKFKKGNKK